MGVAGPGDMARGGGLLRVPRLGSAVGRGMSVRERRNRKDRRAKTPAQLRHRRCVICMGLLRRGEQTRGVPGGRAHLTCPDWPPA